MKGDEWNWERDERRSADRDTESVTHPYTCRCVRCIREREELS